MSSRTRIWPRLAAALVMSLAGGLAWGFVTVWGGYLISSLWASDDSVYEMLHVTRDGIPVIQTSSSRMVNDQTFRTLDGQPYEIEYPDWLPAAYFISSPNAGGFMEVPVPWSQRVAGMNDQARPLTGWYLIRDAEPVGHAYIVGYDELSRLLVGYIGRDGFRRTMPPTEEMFELGRHTLSWHGPVASAGQIAFGGRVPGYFYSYGGNEGLQPWTVYLIDGERLLEINLRTRNVQTIFESPEIFNVGIVWGQASPQQTEGEQQPTPQTLTRATAGVSRVALRLADRIVILDPLSGEKREFLMPELLRSRPLEAYVIRPNQLLNSIVAERISIRPNRSDLARAGGQNRPSEFSHPCAPCRTFRAGKRLGGGWCRARTNRLARRAEHCRAANHATI